jgi:dipeptidyl aminopeptidase/acylaminoacyl peptidase
VDPNGSGLVDLTDLAGGPGAGQDPSVAPNGLVAFTVGAGTAAEIWTMRSDGSTPRRLTTDAFADRMPAVSPDGSRIVYVSDRGGPGGPDLWTVAADGSDPQPLLTETGDDLSPQFSADGNYVVLSTNASGNFDIAYVTTAGAPHANATSITSRSSLDQTTPSIQPDMVRLAYTQTTPAGASDIFTAYSDDGTDEFPLAVDPSQNERSPAFSPDSTEVVYATDAGLVRAAAGGSSASPLAVGPATGAADPDWAVGAPVDRAPPETSITKAPKSETERRNAKFRFQSNEPGSNFECRVDQRTFRSCESPLEYRRMSLGRHRFWVRAIDAAGNRDRSPASARFAIVEPG